MRSARRSPSRPSGYSLLELAVVLTILGSVGGAGLQMGSLRTEQQRIESTDATLDLIEAALAKQVASGGALVCPARADIGPDDAVPARAAQFALGSDCTAAATPGLHDALPPGGTARDRLRYGAVPTRSLGLPDAAGFDGWGRRIVYGVVASLAVDATTYARYATALTTGVIEVDDATGSPIVEPRGGNVIAYALFSPGRDGNGAYARNGTLAPCLTGRLDSANCAIWSAVAATPLRDARYMPEIAAGHFDDRLRFRPLYLLDTAGDSATTPVSTPASPAVAAGGHFSCLVKADGRVACWGAGGRGQLGQGSLTDSVTPVSVSGLVSMKSVVAGTTHACALGQDGSVWCWGAGDSGQLGDGSGADLARPVRVPLGSAVAIAAGDRHSCAVLAEGGVMCWGLNATGQLGDGTTTLRLTPVAVSGMANALSIGAGDGHSCAGRSDNTIWCWGDNTHGQLGDGTTTARHSPVKALMALGGSGTVAGADHSCAVAVGGTVACWGYNGHGQLGNGLTVDQPLPVAVIGPLAVASLSADGDDSCAIKADGTTWCWGANNTAQLGDGTLLQRLLPTIVPAYGSVAQLSMGSSHACAVSSLTAKTTCWGGNPSGEIGVASPSTVTTPTATGL